MSIELNWETLAGGEDGAVLAETVRAFIHDRFQKVTLPRFIRSVQVHSFDFGSVAPSIVLKDICDPLPDFYEDSAEDDDEEEDEEDGEARDPAGVEVPIHGAPRERLHQGRSRFRDSTDDGNVSRGSHQPLHVDTRLSGLRSAFLHGDQLGSPLLSRAATPGILSGTSSLGYFHLPLSAGLSGTTTPLAAVAGAQFQHGFQIHHHPLQRGGSVSSPPLPADHHSSSADSMTPPSTASPPSRPSSRHQRIASFSGNGHFSSSSQSPDSTRKRESSPDDVQIVSHVTYSGDITLSLTAEILLDYPMPSFVGIPLKLNVTGMTFDGVAILAYIKKRAHFCFLSPEDADALIGREVKAAMASDADAAEGQGSGSHRLGGLLEEIRVESEIGQKEKGKQVLKNVGKVEKFVLEQVRRIFEDEFVYPSFWTFLV
ncbi:Mitochondrial distribution and morphology protein 12 [Elasticomyces elasticus]|nr:Mitochondrial distribution and morphology protein 12 [Elasticomyces elasticus]